MNTTTANRKSPSHRSPLDHPLAQALRGPLAPEVDLVGAALAQDQAGLALPVRLAVGERGEDDVAGAQHLVGVLVEVEIVPQEPFQPVEQAHGHAMPLADRVELLHAVLAEEQVDL